MTSRRPCASGAPGQTTEPLLGSADRFEVFIAAERGDLSVRAGLALLDPAAGDFSISVVTVFELLHGIHRATPTKRAAREAYVENALQTFPILAFDEAGRL